MNKKYRCLWYTLPDRQKHTATYPTLEEARAAMANIIRNAVNPQKYTDRMRRHKDPDITEAADFLDTFFTDLNFPESGGGTSFCESGLGEFHATEEELHLAYYQGECLVVDACHKQEVDQLPDAFLPEAYIISFVYDNPNKTRHCYGVQTEIWPTLCGTSAYPLLIWKVLGEKPQTQDAIIRKIRHCYNITIERKAVGKHLTMLQALGFRVQHNDWGYFLGGESHDPEPGTQFSPSAYPLLVLQVLREEPQTQTALLDAIQARFGVKMGRKALAGHLELLEALAFPVEKGKDGYYLAK